MPEPVQKSGYHLRMSTEHDAGTIVQLIMDLAVYEKCPEHAQATPALIKKSLFEDRVAQAVLAFEGTIESPGEAVGMAVYFFNFSTWTGKAGLYLEDLFVAESQRGKGIGKALFAWLGKAAKERDCARIQWQVLDWNAPSIAFYKSLGAEMPAEWLNCRLTGDAMERLADLA